MDINLELYKIFYHVATTGSFSEAAAKLFISQSAVSQTIKNLETKLGVTLFLRQTRNVKLTREGELLLTHFDQAYNFIKSAENKLVEMQNLETGEIRIGASDTVCKYFLIPYLEQFHASYPKIKIQFLNRTSPQIISALKSGMIDFGVVTLPADDDSLLIHELISLQDVFIASNKYAALKGIDVSWEALQQYPILLLEKRSSTRRNLDQFLLRKDIKIIPEMELESVDLLVEFAKIGLGIAHVLRESAISAIESDQVFVVKTESPLPIRKLGLITNKQVPLSPAGKRLIEIMVESQI